MHDFLPADGVAARARRKSGSARPARPRNPAFRTARRVDPGDAGRLGPVETVSTGGLRGKACPAGNEVYPRPETESPRNRGREVTPESTSADVFAERVSNFDRPLKARSPR